VNELGATPRTRVRRMPERAVESVHALHEVLDSGLTCHVGFVFDGYPVVIPMAYGRQGDRLYLHGSSGSRMLRTLAGGTQVCATVTLVDGLVLARSAAHHSMNYRSAVIFGTAVPLDAPEEKLAALRVIVDHLVPGRWEEARPPTRKELAATAALSICLDEASVKVRSGPPKDEDADYALPIWAGVVPLMLRRDTPQPDPRLSDGVALPRSIDALPIRVG
jgi:nitroimidazol reductase NimA-like FMN-containing flavoprotein (pyridoxamine 5'-phosphate oxidase superfamily)